MKLKKNHTIFAFLIFFLIVFGFTLIASCGSNGTCVVESGYEKKLWGIYYHPKGGFEEDTYKVKGTDYRTFTIIDRIYAKDINHFYTYGTPVEEVNPNTVEILTYPYFKDDRNFYYYSSKMSEADYDSFKVLDMHYAKDKNHVYSGSFVIKDADSNSFQLLKEKNSGIAEYARDKNFAFFKNQKIEGSDGSTFTILDYAYTKDKNNVYFTGTNEEEGYTVKRIELADPNTFILLNFGLTKDKNFVYQDGKIIKDADGATFEMLEDYYLAKDKNNIYFRFYTDVGNDFEMRKLEGADPKTFHFLNSFYARDDDSIFCIDYITLKNASYSPQIKPLQLADDVSFEVMIQKQAKDKNYFYNGCSISD